MLTNTNVFAKRWRRSLAPSIPASRKAISWENVCVLVIPQTRPEGSLDLHSILERVNYMRRKYGAALVAKECYCGDLSFEFKYLDMISREHLAMIVFISEDPQLLSLLQLSEAWNSSTLDFAMSWLDWFGELLLAISDDIADRVFQKAFSLAASAISNLPDEAFTSYLGRTSIVRTVAVMAKTSKDARALLDDPRVQCGVVAFFFSLDLHDTTTYIIVEVMINALLDAALDLGGLRISTKAASWLLDLVFELLRPNSPLRLCGSAPFSLKYPSCGITDSRDEGVHPEGVISNKHATSSILWRMSAFHKPPHSLGPSPVWENDMFCEMIFLFQVLVYSVYARKPERLRMPCVRLASRARDYYQKQSMDSMLQALAACEAEGIFDAAADVSSTRAVKEFMEKRPFAYRKISNAMNLRKEDTNTSCGNCGLTRRGTASLLKCNGCKIVHYCGRTCQESHWILHKKICKRLRNLQE